jgi:hypothetical protein
MKYAAKADRNQPEIVSALRGIGAKVIATHTIGQGFPDLVVSYGGRTMLLEIKDGTKPPSARKLTPAQEEFHAAWTGEIHVVDSIEQAIAVTRGTA